MKRVVFAGVACMLGFAMTGSLAAQQTTRYRGPCDASAAAPLDADHFVVANDETNTLNIYRRGEARAVGALSLGGFLGAGKKDEADIEAAAAVGARIYWITSHGRDSSGRPRPSRQRFFATELRPGDVPTVAPIGTPYRDLLRDLTESEALAPYRLADAAKRAAEADGGLNIEGLAATPGGQLLIGLRNPLPRLRALVIPLQNPAEVIEGRRAVLGAAIELDLGGRGIRAIAQVGAGYVISAGPPADRGTFALYRWSGNPGDAPVPMAGIDLGDLRPEALFAIPQTAQLQLLSDDGGVTTAGVECKKLPAAQQSFRSLIVTP